MSQTQQNRRQPIDALERMLELAQDGDFIAFLRRQRSRQMALAVCHRDGRENASRGIPREQTRARVVRNRVRAGGRNRRAEARELAAAMQLVYHSGGEILEDNVSADDVLGELAIDTDHEHEEPLDPVRELALIECGCDPALGCASVSDVFSLLGVANPILEMDEAGWNPEGTLDGCAAFMSSGFGGFHVVDDLRTWGTIDD